MGIIIDARFSFDAHLLSLKEKIRDRINILRILTWDKNWRLKIHFLLNFYKVLVRSLLDYSSIISAAYTNDVTKALEVMQNDALRVIFKKSLLDQISSHTLREWAGVESIAERQNSFFL